MDETQLFARVLENLSIVTVMATWLFLERKERREQALYYREQISKLSIALSDCLTSDEK